MKRSESSINSFLSTLNVVLLFAGYQFLSSAVSIFMGSAEEPQLLNAGYKFFYAIVCILVIIYNIGSKPAHSNRIILVLFIFWALLLLRFIDDMYLRPDISVLPSIRFRTWFYMVVLTLMPMVSISLSIEKINFASAFKWTTILISAAIVITFYQNFNYDTEEIEAMARESSEGLSSIGTGHLGLTAIILAVCNLISGTKKERFVRIALILVAILGVIVMLRSGSRGPLLAFLGAGAMLGISRTKRPFIWAPVIIIFILFHNQIFDLFINGISYIAPNLSSRFLHKAELGGQFDTRMFYYSSAIEAFLENPMIGKQFAIYLPGQEMIYSHNLFLDSIMQLGIIGGVLILSIIVATIALVYKLIRRGSSMVWICLLFIQELLYLMLSSSLYYTPLFSILIVMLFQWDSLEQRRCQIQGKNS